MRRKEKEIIMSKTKVIMFLHKSKSPSGDHKMKERKNRKMKEKY